MQLPFEKYQGTGNDFILIDNRERIVDAALLPIHLLCDRRFGIGADGLILIEEHPELDFNMIYFNSDGSQSFCGNGSRCAVEFARKLGLIGNSTRFLSTDGEHEARFSLGKVELKMHDVHSWLIDTTFCFANTGSPHHIQFRDNVHSIDLLSEARAIRYNEPYTSEGVNVNFVEDRGDVLKMRTYERGVEDETLSCGTGVTAVALMGHLRRGATQGAFETIVEAPGGALSVRFHFDGHSFTDVWLIGPAEHVFSGQITL
ncbi:MAG: diaminopimelate epimerase [Flavobacteriales bacterium]|nr:diaminopimelate epimerase [Flavobacteriales bacterium]